MFLRVLERKEKGKRIFFKKNFENSIWFKNYNSGIKIIVFPFRVLERKEKKLIQAKEFFLKKLRKFDLV